MTWQHALAGFGLTIGVVAATPALRQVFLWCLKNYEEATQTAFLLLFITLCYRLRSSSRGWWVLSHDSESM
jgi:hypothetical protein